MGEAATPVAQTGPTPAVATPSTTSTTERRLVSVLFADLVGFTTLSESRDSEDVRDLLSGYFDTCRTVISRYGGTIEKFIGDAVMAVWGTPVANEDDAERAVRTAIDLVGAVAVLGAEVGAPDLAARAGVLTGEATVNLGVSGQGMVAGDLVNTASRIQSAAEPGTVLVGEGTKRATEAAVVFADAGEHTLKGKAEPVRLWRALRVAAGRGGLMKSEGLEPPFVGRDRELKLVKDLFHACVEEAKAHLVQVSGIAGIGKSRLGWEVFKYLDGLQRVFLWHRGRCLAYGEGVTYWALAEMVRGRAGILEGEDRSSAATKLHATVERYVLDPEDRRFVEPRLAHLLGLEDRTAPDKADLFAGWRLFFERLASSDPVFMLFEDLQWADPSLVEFIDHLLEWSRSLPIFVMTLARPDAAISLAGAKRNATSISLEPLPAGAMAQLLTGLVPGLPPEVTTKILDRAEGVPLYAVETVRMLLDRGLLIQDGAVYRPSGPIEDLEVPETLHALIAARLDGLGPEERRMVQDASVLGKAFTREALASLSGLPERALEPLLASLVAKEVLSVQADPRSPERGQYGFLQDLVRTVAYETLAKRDRKTKHLQAAAYLEQAWGQDEEEIVEVVASHYLEAYELLPEAEDAGVVKAKALEMLIRAGERAASLAAAEEAQRYFERAFELTSSRLEQAGLAERAGQMAWLRGKAEETTDHFERATGLFEELGDPHRAARVQARRAQVDYVEGHIERALDRMERALAVLSQEEPTAELATVAGQLGRFLALAGRDKEALPHLELSLELAENLQLPEVFAQALSSRAVGLTFTNRLDESATLLRRALEVALEHNLWEAALRAYNNLAEVMLSLDRFEEEMRLNAEALELARKVGNRFWELLLLSNRLSSPVMAGRWDEALQRQNLAQAAQETSSFEAIVVQLLDVVPIHVHRGELDRARALLEATGVAEGSGDPQVRAMRNLYRAVILLAEGRPSDALAAAERTLAGRAELGMTWWGVKEALVQSLEAALGMQDLSKAEELLGMLERLRPGELTPYLRAHGARFAARLSVLRDAGAAAESGFDAAARGFRDLATPFWLAVTLFEHAQFLAGAGRAEEAAPLLSEAREIFEQLKARPWLDRLDRLAGMENVTA